MSTIFGIFSPKNPDLFSTDHLAAMAAAMRHSSPMTKTFADPAAGAGLGLAYIPAFLASGEAGEPAWLDDENLLVALAGTLDLNVIPDHATNGHNAQAIAVKDQYEAADENFPLGLDGVFNLAVWDKGKAALTLATDILRNRPLYYHHNPVTGYFAFASELSALLRLSTVLREIDYDGLASYLVIGYVPAPFMIVRDIRTALPFEKLTLDRAGQLASKRYYRLPLAEPGPLDLDYWTPRLEQELVGAMERVTRKTPAIALAFSAGVDSAAVLAALRELGGPHVTAITVAYLDGVENEIEPSATLARSLGAEPLELLVRPAELTPELLSTAFRQFDQPVDTFSRGPTQYLLAAAAQKQGITACVTGLLGENVIGELSWEPGLRRLAKRSPQTAGDNLILRLLADGKDFFTTADLKTIMRPEISIDADGRAQISRAIDKLTVGVSGNPEFEAYMNFTVLLARTGNLSVAGQVIPVLLGVEERAAFADRRLWEFVQSIPADHKSSDTSKGRKRALLTAAFQEQLATEGQGRVHRRDKGSYPGVPWHAQPWFEALVLRQAKRAAGEGLIEPNAVEKVLRKHNERRAKRDKKNVWHLFVLQAWLDFHFNDIDPFEESPEPTLGETFYE